MSSVPIHPSGIVLMPKSSRVLVRSFVSSDPERVEHILDRAFSLSDEAVAAELGFLRAEFHARHHDLEACWRRHFTLVAGGIGDRALTADRKLYIGALFSGEYAIESAALFNPSIVAHPDQSGLADSDLRFVLSLRATGEGHISSIEFRSGVVHADFRISLDPVSPYVTAPGVKENPTYRKSVFTHKLDEMGFDNEWSRRVMAALGRDFTHEQLRAATAEAKGDASEREANRTMECIHWLASSNYEISFPPGVALSQRIIFPVSANESNGIEDARFVLFEDEDGSRCYYATYTAYNGHAILPQLIETVDLENFRVLTLNGRAAQNKGMALFPRRIGGRYAMLSRQDDENLYVMFSDNLHFWNEPRFLASPRSPWEFVKIGNCGSPIETPEGWLVIMHGVGPMRRYCIGAMLLDRDQPDRVLGRLVKPLVEPEGELREGYVPNVVYSCGAMLHGSRLIFPYAFSDTKTTIATIELSDLLGAMTRPDARP